MKLADTPFSEGGAGEPAWAFDSPQRDQCSCSPTGRGIRLKPGRVLVRIQPGAPRAVVK